MVMSEHVWMVRSEIFFMYEKVSESILQLQSYGGRRGRSNKGITPRSVHLLDYSDTNREHRPVCYELKTSTVPVLAR